VKSIYLDRKEILSRIEKTSEEALRGFEEIRSIRLFGSLARGEETGLSDIDLCIIADIEEGKCFEKMKEYFYFFIDRLKFSLDIIVVPVKNQHLYEKLLSESLLLKERD
jgi:predicted nucleotidyltransferase